MIRFLGAVVAATLLVFSSFSMASDKKAQVESLMDDAISHYNSAGADQAFKDFANREGKYFLGDIYVAISRLDGEGMVFHAANPKLVGKKLLKLKDTDGKPFAQEIHDVANGAGAGWVSYKWPHPASNKLAQKHTYVKATGDVYFLIGYYE